MKYLVKNKRGNGYGFRRGVDNISEFNDVIAEIRELQRNPNEIKLSKEEYERRKLNNFGVA